MKPAPRDYTQLSDNELLGFILRKDREALSALYDRFVRQVFSLSLRMVENQSLAEEIVQDVFMTVWSRGGSYKNDRGAFSSWLMSIAHNRCIDELRRRRRRAKLPTVPIEDLTHEPKGNEEEVTDEVFAKLDREAIVQAMSKLPPAQRQVITMAYFQALTQSEISNVLATPLGTIKTRMRLGLQKMRDLLAV